METRVYRPTPRNLKFLAQRLQQDELVAVPAETVYGLAGNGLSATACGKIFEAKRRPTNDPLILHLHDRSQAHALCHWNEAAECLAQHFWPGPLTLVLPKLAVVPDLATSGRPSVALRAPSHPVFRELLRLTELPLAAPSANPFGYISPTSAAHVKDNLAGRIHYVLDGGDCTYGLESTVLDLRSPAAPRVLRPGVITAEMISDRLGVKVTPITQSPADVALAPGLQDQHYSPRTPLVLFQDTPVERREDDALVYFQPQEQAAPTPQSFSLTPSGDGREAAHRLFRLLRQLDRQGFARIQVQLPPEHTVYYEAIVDRLTRAAKK